LTSKSRRDSHLKSLVHCIGLCAEQSLNRVTTNLTNPQKPLLGDVWRARAQVNMADPPRSLIGAVLHVFRTQASYDRWLTTYHWEATLAVRPDSTDTRTPFLRSLERRAFGVLWRFSQRLQSRLSLYNANILP
jgi:hypothetical protein